MTSPSSKALVATTAGFVLFASFDVFWFLRLASTFLSALFRRGGDHSPDEDSSVLGLCWTTDVDYFLHMNNSRYLREMDFGRFNYYFRTGLSRHLTWRHGISVVQHAAMIRYRRSIDLLMPFRLHTRLVWFDERSFYFEQRFVTVRDGFVRAVALSKVRMHLQIKYIHIVQSKFQNTAINCDVPNLMQKHFPHFKLPTARPAFVDKFIEADEMGSQSLRHELGLKTA